MHPVVTLTGILTDPQLGLKTLVDYYFKSVDANFEGISGPVLSFIKDLHQEKPEEAIRNSLITILRGHFEDAEVNVSVDEGVYTVSIQVTDGGQTIPLEEVHESVGRTLLDGDT